MKLQLGFASILGLVFILCSFILDGYNLAEGAMVAQKRPPILGLKSTGVKNGMNVKQMGYIH